LLLIAATLSWATPARADTGPTLSIGSTSVVRSVTDAVTAYFTVTLSSVQATPVSYDFATADGSAVAGVDYEATSGTKTMQPGATRSKVEVKIYGVGPGHPDPETSKVKFTVTISNPVGASILGPTGTGTILEVPSISIGDVTVLQALTKATGGHGGVPGTAAFFTVTLSFKLRTPVTVDFATSDGTAVNHVDYKRSVGSRVIAAGSNHLKIRIKIKAADSSGYVPGLETTTYYVGISTPTANIYVLKAQGTGTIDENVAPGAPQSASATPGAPLSGSVTLNWSPPTDTGNSSIASYSYATSTDGGNTFGSEQNVGDVTSTTAACPTGDSCVYEVFATNAYAEGPAATTAAVTGP
jgi:chitinase